MNKLSRILINPVTIVLVAMLLYMGLILWAYSIGLQHGKDYMVQHYQVLGIN